MKSTLRDIKEASYMLGLTEQQVRNLCRNGKLDGQQIGRSWVIKDSDIQNYKGGKKRLVAEDQATYLTRDQILAKKKPIVLSFFSGAMGLDLGLEQAGFETILCSEIDKACRQTILSNKPKIALLSDIRNYSPQQIREAAGLALKDEIDVVVGGPPCQAFSTAGKRMSLDDSRGNVLITFIETIIELNPKYAVIENVRGILSAPLRHRPHNQRGPEFPPLTKEEQSGGVMNYILQRLKKAGYSVSFNLYNSANFGTPQKRERVVILCSRDTDKLPYLVPTHSEFGSNNLPPWKTFKEATHDIQKKSHTHINFPEKRLRFYRMLKPGQYWKHLPEDLQKEALGASFYAGGGKTGFLRRLGWNQPAPTLVTNPAMPATDLAHPVKDRPLSVEEYKRIQEFPDDWKFAGSILDQYKQIGNAVPVSLGKAIGKVIMNSIKGRSAKLYPNFQYSRYANTNDTNWMADVKSKGQLSPLLF
jgi:DNA (cytosine-5)-methyltransferase 1